LFADHQPDLVMHLAAETHVDRSIAEPGTFIQSNITGTFNLLNSARQYFDGLTKPQKDRFRFHHVSTDEVYGSLEATDAAFDETTPYDPHSPYSASKAASDHLVRSWHKTYGLPVVVTNCSNNYGPYQFPEKLIPVVISRAIRGQPIPVYGQGKNIRDWLFVTDHVQALYAVAMRGTDGETYNIGGDSEIPNIQLVRIVCQILDELHPIAKNERLGSGSRIKIGSYAELITFVADRPGHDFRYAMNADKIRNQLGWQPREDLQGGLRKTIGWYLENKNWHCPSVYQTGSSVR